VLELGSVARLRGGDCGVERLLMLAQFAQSLACGGELGAKDAGRMRVEGKDYVVRDGDVMLVRFNV